MPVSKKQFEELELKVILLAGEVEKLIAQYNENMLVINEFMNAVLHPEEVEESPIITLRRA